MKNSCDTVVAAFFEVHADCNRDAFHPQARSHRTITAPGGWLREPLFRNQKTNGTEPSLDDTGFAAKSNWLFSRYSEYLQPAGFVAIFSRAINQSLSKKMSFVTVGLPRYIAGFAVCITLRRMVRSWAILSLLSVAGGAIASPFDGSWIYEKSGHFSLELIENRNLVCGQVTSISGHRVDGSWVVGRIKGKRAVVQFASGFGEGSGRGTATIRPLTDGMEWRVVQFPPGESWIFDAASASAAPWEKGRRALLKKWCAENWSAIKRGRTDDVELRP